MENKYSDIINLDHFVSKSHPQMSVYDRAAQFSPFAALTGFDSEIKETGRLTHKRIELDEEKKEELRKKINFLILHPEYLKDTEIKFFRPDKYKSGGEYITIKGIVKFKEYERKIILKEDIVITFDQIIEIIY